MTDRSAVVLLSGGLDSSTVLAIAADDPEYRTEGGAQAGAERDALDIPDPYGGDAGDFSAVLDLIETAARHIAAQLTGMLAGRAPA